MKKYECPCCGSEKHVEFDLHSEGFAEDLFECSSCGAEWIFKHNAIEVIKDSNENSFIAQDDQCTDGTVLGIV